MKRMARDAIVVAVAAGVTFQVLRQQVGDRYVVPSDSMQPTLYGAAVGGDVVFVDKLASAAALRRYDLAVFRAAGEQSELVKRVVAFGDDPSACRLELRDGDLWLGPDAQRLQRATKEPLDCRDLRVPWLAWPGPQPVDGWLGPAPASGQLLVPAFERAADARAACRDDARRALAAAIGERGDPSGGGWLLTLRAVDAGYLDAHGGRGTEGASILVDDVGADVLLACAGVDAVLCGLDLRPDSWLFHWRPATGEVELWRNGVTVATRTLPASGAATGADAAFRRLEYGFLDGRFFFAVDGDEERLWIEPRRPEWLAADPGPSAWTLPKNRLYLGVVAAGPAPLARLQVFHDVHWYRPQVEVGVDPARFSPVKEVPPGHVYLLGDNAADSRDSRMFGPVPLTGFVGRPRFVLGPWPRRCALVR